MTDDISTWDPKGPATDEDLRALLTANAIDPDLAISRGVAVANDKADLPDSVWSGVDLPAVVWPWHSPYGGVAYQAQPPRHTVDAGKPKYRFAKDHLNVLSEVRKPGTDKAPIIVVEGTKQMFAVASATPSDYGVYGMAGCWGWKSKGAPILDLEVANGRDVFVILDADAASNGDVYAAGEALSETLVDTYEAKKVKFVQLPGSKNAGADDVLSAFPVDRRAEMMRRWINAAKDKPAKSKPPKRTRSDDAIDLEDISRPVIEINNDRLQVISELTDTLVQHCDRDTLFQQDGVLVNRNEDTLRIMTHQLMPGVIAPVALTVKQTNGGAIPAWPDKETLWAVLDQAKRFSRLSHITPSPFVRDDGTIATKEGYDEKTHAYVRLSKDMKGIEVPEEPTSDDVEAAVDLLLDEMLGDFPLMGDTPRANALALLLTPFIRGQVDIVPLCVVNAHAPGTGKTKFAGLAAMIATGREARQGSLNSPEEEIRKNITAGLIEGETFVLYDEAHEIDSAQLVEKITSPVVTDRPLGMSKLMRFQNKLTWVAAGNNVAVQADMGRRHYRVDMFYEGDDPSLRDPSMYRHQDLNTWVKDNRRALVRACLLIIRAWYAAGQPKADSMPKFGSFEQWTTRMSGILAYAGVPGFLADMEEARSDSDYTTATWREHLLEMNELTGGEWMSTKELCKILRQAPDITLPPVDDFDPLDKQATRRLGMAYGGVKGRPFSGIMVEKSAKRVGSRGWLYRTVVSESIGDITVANLVNFSENFPSLNGENAPAPNTASSYRSRAGEPIRDSKVNNIPAPVDTPVSESVTIAPGSGSAFTGGILAWSPSSDDPNVLTTRLPTDWVRPPAEAMPPNDRFDVLLAMAPPPVNRCSTHGEQPPHPRGGHLASCPVCYPSDYLDNRFQL